MASYTEISAAPRYRKRAVSTSVPFVNATLKLADLGTTSIISNVNLHRSLAGRVPQVQFSTLGSPPRPLQPRIATGGLRNQGIPSPTPFASPEALSDVGTGIRNFLFPKKLIGGESQFAVLPLRQTGFTPPGVGPG